jgi:hypothetical protein
LGKSSYLLRLHFGRYLDKIGRFFTKHLVTLLEVSRTQSVGWGPNWFFEQWIPTIGWNL